MSNTGDEMAQRLKEMKQKLRREMDQQNLDDDGGNYNSDSLNDY